MVFSLDTLKNPSNNVFGIESVEEISSFFEETLQMIISEQEEFLNMISEAVLDVNLNIKHEWNINFNIFEKIFDWFVKILDKISSYFLSFLVQLLSKNNQLKYYKKRLERYEGSIRYNKPYYEFRNLDLSTSYTSYQTEVEREYNDIISNLSRIKLATSMSEINSIISNMKNETLPTNIEEELNSIRGKVLGSMNPITAQDFADALFVYFRGESKKKDNVGIFEKNIDSDRIKVAYRDYYNANKQESRIKRDKNILRIEALKQKAQIKLIKPTEYIPEYKSNPDIISDYNYIITQKCRKVKSICDIYLMVFSAKLDALREYNLLNREILLIAIKQMVREERKL